MRGRDRTVAAAALGVAAAALMAAALGGCDTRPGDVTETKGASGLYQVGEPSESAATESAPSAVGAITPLADDIPLGETGSTVPGVSVLYGPTPEQQLVIDKAEYGLVSACMAERGFDYLDPLPTLQAAPPNTFKFDSYVGMLDPDYGRQFGYQLDPAMLVGENQGHVMDNAPPGYEEALRGGTDPNGGCAAMATNRLEAGLPDTTGSVTAFGDIGQKALAMTEDDPAYKEVRAQWSKCMKAKGFDYAGPEAAMARYEAFNISQEAIEGAAPNPSSEERATAVADVECKHESDLYQVWRAKYWGYQLELEAANRPALESTKRETEIHVANAQKALEELGIANS